MASNHEPPWVTTFRELIYARVRPRTGEEKMWIEALVQAPIVVKYTRINEKKGCDSKGITKREVAEDVDFCLGSDDAAWVCELLGISVAWYRKMCKIALTGDVEVA